MSKKFHFIAIGGVGQSGIAKFLLEKGMQVSGSDIYQGKYMHLLKALGAKVFIGHDAKNVPNNATVVVSTAINEKNPELIRAKELGLEIMHRSDMLKYISEISGQEFLGFCGTHGKTTTSGMCAYLLSQAEMDPSFVIGGIVPALKTNGQRGDGKHFVAELDESDGTLVKYSPSVCVINNIEEDHVDYYTNGLDDIIKVFDKFTKPLKKVVVNADCPNCRKLKEYKRFTTFGINDGVYRAKNIKYDEASTTFDAYKNGELLGEVKLSIIGEHNVYNALAVIAALSEANIEFKKYQRYFRHFTGMGRRFQVCAEFSNIKVIDDYAHHPSEIKTTLSALRKSTKNRIVAVFQPHRYTRLKALWKEFLNSFANCDLLFVLDVYAAGDKHDKQFNSNEFAKESKKGIYIKGNIETAAKKILPYLKSGDRVITLGAGDITNLGTALENEYRA